MKVSIGQLAVTNDKAANLAAIAQATSEAARESASVIVFPEMAMWFQRGLSNTYVQAGETIPGQFTAAIDAIAAEHRVSIVVGMLEVAEGEARVYNTIYITSADGKAIGTYQKVHLYDAFGLQESEFIAPSVSTSAMVFEIEGTTFGVMTCYDLRFPESARDLVDAGAQVLLLPSCWTPGVRKEDHWDTLVRARAIENTSYVIASNQAAPLSTGASMIVDPMGIVVAQLREGAETRSAEVSVQRVIDVRATNPSVANRRFSVMRSATVIG
ncbi:carbon-nitrogen hydrolase family protein [Agrobacterium tumefaciens]|uniref:carbon-nitrogen hydrolase family protein n=1 Tax=Agrobacterium tumefaciens TaxID=358 RepID=UPI0012B899E8|nr:carbon-nitrogen hydrolase family protein [Agrobacterium tumefaciens]MQB07276.1 carbon-nitrogen hydrolase family protein [Agrobacterium tumefaciens]